MIIMFMLICGFICIVANIEIVPEGKVYVIERMGAYYRIMNSGVHFKTPFIDKVARRLSLKEQIIDCPSCPALTKDNVKMKMEVSLFFQIVDPRLYTYCADNPLEVLEFLIATSVRNIIVDMSKDQVLNSGESLNIKILEDLEPVIKKLGIKILLVRVTDILTID